LGTNAKCRLRRAMSGVGVKPKTYARTEFFSV
jgi:hypothetical protein